MTRERADRVPRQMAARIALGYAGLSAVWIVASTLLASAAAGGASKSVIALEVSKGLAFVAVTAALLYTLVYRAVHALRQAHAQKLQALQRLTAITSTMPDGLLVCTGAGELEYANAVAAQTLGLDPQLAPEDAHEQLCRRFLDPNGLPFAAGMSPFDLARRASAPVYGMEVRVDRADGRTVYLRLNTTAVRAADGSVETLITTFTDISRERESAKALARAQRALTVLSLSSASAMHADGGDALCLEACRALTSLGGYRFAWVGTPDPGPERRLQLRAQVGVPPELHASWTPHWGVSADVAPIEIQAHREGRAVVLSGSELADAKSGWPAVAHALGLGSVIAVPIQAPDHTPLGILAIGSDNAEAFVGEELALLGILANQLAHALTANDAPSERDRALLQLRRIVDGSVRTIQAVVELRDPYTVGHEERVSQLAVAIARRLGLPDVRVEALEIAARLHDLGKAVVPTEILSKPGRLNPQEIALVRLHVDVGYRILREAGFPDDVAEIVRQHHERLDGTGYPRGLAGDQLLLEARILAVADVAESMVTHRPYRAARGMDEALIELQRGRGGLYEAEVVDECIALLHSGFLEESAAPVVRTPRDALM